MGAVMWPRVWRTFPGPLALAVWMLVTVSAPLMFFRWAHRWEEDLEVSTALWWTVGAAPVLAAVVAARWAGCTGRRRSPDAVIAATLAAAVFASATIAVYRWVIPLGGDLPWRNILVGGVPLVVCGAVGGALRRRGGRRGPGSTRRHRCVAGGIVAVVGAVLAPTTVRLGAEDSTVPHAMVEYGAVGPYAAATTAPGVARLPAAGRYAIFAVGFSPADPDCEVAGVGVPPRSATAVTIAPADYGGDHASFAWVASFDAPAPGGYSLTCRTADPAASYTVGEVPRIRGAVGALIHWPLTAIWLLGALPGLLVIAVAARRRARALPAGEPFG